MGHVNTAIMLGPCVLFLHAVPNGHVLGGDVRVPDDRANLGCFQDFESVFLAGFRGFRRISLMPITSVEELPDF